MYVYIYEWVDEKFHDFYDMLIQFSVNITE